MNNKYREPSCKRDIVETLVYTMATTSYYILSSSSYYVPFPRKARAQSLDDLLFLKIILACNFTFRCSAKLKAPACRRFYRLNGRSSKISSDSSKNNKKKSDEWGVGVGRVFNVRIATPKRKNNSPYGQSLLF